MKNTYLNRDAETFLADLPEAEREWAQVVIGELKRRYPMADHWTTGGAEFKYVDIRIGRKAMGKKAGQPVFYLRQGNVRQGKPVSLLVNAKARMEESDLELSSHSAPGVEQIRGWFDTYKLSETGYARLEGSGLSPSDYVGFDTSDERSADEDANAPVLPEAQQPVQALNRILYGPPGTGKTYRTVSEALTIIEHTDAPAGDFDVQKKRFDSLRAEGRIAFVTFHQSFSYEDFIEGIRAEAVDGQLSYKVKDGIFKKMAIAAMYQSPDEAGPGVALEFDVLYDAFLGEVAAMLPYSLTSARGGELTVNSINTNGTVNLTHPGRNVPQGVSRARMRKLYKAYPNLAAIEGKPVTNVIVPVIGGANITAYWAVLNALLGYKERDKDELAEAAMEALSADLDTDYEQIKRRVLAGDTLAPNGKPYVLIIDEINRGNMSRIFGELITLIEPSKRAGRRETAEVQLPYSNERFSVPSNLYIVGTMNTADRSLAVVDTALRRRFDFIEMMPEPGQLKDKKIGAGAAEVDLIRMLNTINLRIEHLYDREHMIGHSFFMGLTEDSNLADLALIFKNNILPLLEEYFFEDWEKIGKILGNAGIHEIQPAAKLGFSHSRKVYRRDLSKLQHAATYQAIYREFDKLSTGAVAMVVENG
jgi:5-methylcytosine-specific restriction protein B